MNGIFRSLALTTGFVCLGELDEQLLRLDLDPHNVSEVGAGSGYAAAVLSQIADKVYAIERHPSLAEAARKRFEKLGYDNIELRTGDGTRGWRAVAPFDAILVAAGGPDVPDALKEQLAIGGRLVIPLGEGGRYQTLLKITRRSESEYVWEPSPLCL